MNRFLMAAAAACALLTSAASAAEVPTMVAKWPTSTQTCRVKVWETFHGFGLPEMAREGVTPLSGQFPVGRFTASANAEGVTLITREAGRKHPQGKVDVVENKSGGCTIHFSPEEQ